MSTDGLSEIVDLRRMPPASAHGRALHAVHDMRPGREVILLTDEDPRLLLSQLQHDLRHRLAMQVMPHAGGWRVSVQSREHTRPETLFDVLSRDHERLDRLFVRAHGEVQAQRLPTARVLLGDVTTGLRRHIQIENEILAPRFELPRDRFGSDPLSVMLREHEDIVQQLIIIEELLTSTDVDAAELDTWLGLLSATLSKHEGREETRLFPLWDAQLARYPDAAKLLGEVQARLAPDPRKDTTPQ